MHGFVLEVAAHTRPQRLEILELAEVLRELVVELRDDPLPDRLDRDVVVDRRSGELGDRVVVRVLDLEGFFVAFVESDQLLVEPGRVRRGADFDRDAVVLVGLRFGRRLRRRRLARDHDQRLVRFVPWERGPLQVHHHRVALLDPAPLDRLVARRAFAQAGERFVHRRVLDLRGFLIERDGGVVARLDRRHGFEGRGELQRLAFFDHHVADVRRVDRFDAALAQRFVDRARNQPVRHVVENLVAEALAHDLRRHLAGPEPGHPRRLAVIARDLVDLGVDDLARDLDDEVFLRIADVDEFCLH